jgi:hypothetical protein
MSRAEEITSEVRKLVLTCRSMQAQLEQSIPKKTHQEVVSKMQSTIDGLNGDLERTKNELARTITIGEHVNSLSSQVKAQEEQIASQNRLIESLTAKLAESTVPSQMFHEQEQKNRELEEKVASMVSRADYTSLQEQYSALQSKIDAMVPRSDYEAAQAQIATMVPKSAYDEISSAFSALQEQYAALEKRASTLEARLSESVPRSDFDELTARIAQLTMEATRFATELASVPTVAESSSQISVPVASSAEVIVETPSAPQEFAATAQEVAHQEAPAEVAAAPVGEQAPAQENNSSNVAGNDTPAVAVEPAPAEIVAGPPGPEAQASADVAPEAPAVEAPAPSADPSPVVETIVSAPVSEQAPVAVPEVTETVAAETAPAAEPSSPAETPAVAEVAPAAVENAPAETPAIQEVAAAPVEVTPSPEAPSTVTDQVVGGIAEQTAPQVEEIREVQSQLSEIQGAAEAGQTEYVQVAVDPSRGFRFSNTEYNATSAVDFLQDLEKVPLETIEFHTRNGDFERWFADVLTDVQSAESLRGIREGAVGGEELRAKTIEVIAPRYRAN